MAHFEHKEGSGSLFRNDKGDNAKRPDMRGDILLGGVLYELSAWTREGRDGKPRWLSLAGKVKGERRDTAAPAPKAAEPERTDSGADDPALPF